MFCSKRWALLAMAVGATAPAGAGDPAIEDILNASKSIMNEQSHSPDDAVEIESPKGTHDDEDWSWLKPNEGYRESPNEGATDTTQQRAWNEVMQGVSEAGAAPSAGPQRPPVPDDVMYVYISLAMPKATLRNLFMQALAPGNTRSTIFVLRGWEPPGLNTVVGRLNKLFPEAEKLRELPNVQINPTLFRQQGISVVPTYTTKDKKGRWGTVVGETSLSDAVRRIEENRYDGEVIGATFEIEEPDILAVIEKRIADVDWEKHVERVKADVLTKPTVGRGLPYAEEADSYLVDLTIVNNRDLSGTTGEVFARAGTTINPFDYMTVRRRYVFIDANSDEQIDVAAEWKRQHDYVTFVTTVPVATEKGRKDAIRKLGQPVFEINDMLIRRFKLRAVPAIAYQEGKMLRVDVKAAVTTGVVAMNEPRGSDE